jgi:putative endonuclease
MSGWARRRGATSDAAGRAAESVAEARYRAAGYAVLARRWRGASGEIDLICGRDGGLVFVEVKKARDFDTAAARLTARQAGRVQAAALEFLADRGEPMDRPMRFDLACVDRLGRCETREDLLAA